MFESHDLSPKKNRSSYCVWLKWLVFIIHPFYRSSSLTTSCFISVCPGVLFEYLLSLLLIFTLVFEFQPLSFLIWIIYGLLIRVFPGGPTEKAMATHSSTLAWKIPWTEEPGRLQSMGSLGLHTAERLHFHFHALEKEMATHSSVLAWRIPGMGEPGGLPSVGSHRVGHDWSDLVAVAGGPSGKEPACHCRRHKRHRFDPWIGEIPGVGNGNPLQYSCLENSMDRGAWQATVHRVTKGRHDWSNLAHTQHTIRVYLHLLLASSIVLHVRLSDFSKCRSDHIIFMFETLHFF